jgi:hypothetical protein
LDPTGRAAARAWKPEIPTNRLGRSHLRIFMQLFASFCSFYRLRGAPGDIENAVIRLQAKLEVHEARAAIEAAEAVDHLAFDASEEGERLRRFQLAGQRALLRTVDALLKLRRQEPPQYTLGDPPEPAGTATTGDGLTATISADAAGIHASFIADPLPAVVESPATPEPQRDAQTGPNEPTAAREDPPGTVDDSTPASTDHAISPNEPTAPAGDQVLVEDEPAFSVADPGLQPEPAGSAGGVGPVGRRPQPPQPRSEPQGGWLGSEPASAGGAPSSPGNPTSLLGSPRRPR